MNHSKTIQRVYGQNGGTLPAFAFPGGYPIFYTTEEGECLCASCANLQSDEDPKVTDYFIHYEGLPVFCDQCGCEIESAYGPVLGEIING